MAKMKDLLAHRSPDDEYDFGEAATRVLETYFGGVGDEGKGNASDNNAVDPAAAGPSGEGGDDGAEPPRQRRRRS